MPAIDSPNPTPGPPTHPPVDLPSSENMPSTAPGRGRVTLPGVRFLGAVIVVAAVCGIVLAVIYHLILPPEYHTVSTQVFTGPEWVQFDASTIMGTAVPFAIVTVIALSGVLLLRQPAGGAHAAGNKVIVAVAVVVLLASGVEVAYLYLVGSIWSPGRGADSAMFVMPWLDLGRVVLQNLIFVVLGVVAMRATPAPGPAVEPASMRSRSVGIIVTLAAVLAGMAVVLSTAAGPVLDLFQVRLTYVRFPIESLVAVLAHGAGTVTGVVVLVLGALLVRRGAGKARITGGIAALAVLAGMILSPVIGYISYPYLQLPPLVPSSSDPMIGVGVSAPVHLAIVLVQNVVILAAGLVMASAAAPADRPSDEPST